MGAGARFPASRRVGAIALAMAVVVVFGAGILVGSGTIRLPAAPTPQTIYVTPRPGSAGPSGDVAVIPTLVAPSAAESASPSASDSPAATTTVPPHAATPAPTPTPHVANLRFGDVAAPIYACGEGRTLLAHVTNAGAAPMEHLTHIRLTDSYSGHEDIASVQTIPILAPGASQTFNFSFTISAGCGSDHALTIRIDPEGDLPETTKLDNVWSALNHVRPAGPNLIITGEHQAAHAQCAVGFDMSIAILNRGALGTGHAFQVRVYDKYGSTVLQSKTVTTAALGAHANRTVPVHMTVMSHCGQTHHVDVEVDASGAVTETFEDDNTLSFSYALFAA